MSNHQWRCRGRDDTYRRGQRGKTLSGEFEGGTTTTCEVEGVEERLREG